MQRRFKIDVFTDTVCPWCLIGVARLDRAVAGLAPDVEVDIERHPFYLDPNTPIEGYDVGEMLRSKYGSEPREIWAHAEEQARLSGIDLNLSRQPRTYRTQKDHTLVRLARAKGTQHALANAIAWAYFMEHRPTGEDEVLSDIAVQHGYSRDEAMQVMHDAEALGETHDLAIAAAESGIRGVPFFVFDNRFAVSGAQPQEVFERALRAALGEENPGPSR